MTGMRSVDVTDTEAVLRALERETAVLLDRALTGFLEADFLEYSILDGRLTGGHVVTYLAREADRMTDALLVGIGAPAPPRDRDRQWELDEGGNLRPGAVLIDDLEVSARRLAEALALVDDWDTLPPDLRAIPGHRLVQVIVHHADLGRAWDDFDETDAAAAVAVLPVVLEAELAGFDLVIRPEAAELRASGSDDGSAAISGRSRDLIAWATGRAAPADGVAASPRHPPLRVWI